MRIEGALQLTIYFPIQMHKVQKGVKRFSWYWLWLESIDVVCLFISLAAGTGSVEGIVTDLEGYHPFHTKLQINVFLENSEDLVAGSSPCSIA